MPESRRGTHTPAASPVAHVLLKGEETGAVVSATTILVPARHPGPPLHAHDFDETFYVLDGDLTFRIGDSLTRNGLASSASLRETPPMPWPITATRTRATSSSALPPPSSAIGRAWPRR
jgi:hypothetical protein